MPTLIEESTFGETARASDIAWVEREFDAQSNEEMNDTTLSGSLLVAALDDFRKTQKEVSPSNTYSPPAQPANMDQNVSLLDQSVSLLGSPEISLPPQTPRIAEPPTTAKKSVRITTYNLERLSPGPNQQAYEERYKEFVSKAVDDCRKRFPGKIPNYKVLSQERQRKEQERVLHLLERLQLGGRQVGDTDVEMCKTPIAKDARSLSQDTSTSQKKTLSFAMNVSEVLFSPEPEQDGDPMQTLGANSSATSRHKGETATSHATPTIMSPVEISRGAAQFSSPQLTKDDESDAFRKRMATSSGKRGADTSRRKRVDDSALPSMDFCSPQPKIFTASQSPILSGSDDGEDGKQGRLRKRDESDENSSRTSVDPDISFGGNITDDVDDTFHSIDDDRASRSRPPLGPLRNSVQLKAGASVHFRPLTTRRRQPKSKMLTQAFPDPLDSYSGKAFDKMTSTYKWLRRRLKSKSVAGGVIFSLTEQKIIDLSMKLAVDVAEASYDSKALPQSTASDTLLGQTLIVVRERESLAEWKSAFRERSNLGVICHCELPLKERRSVGTATKCSKYGVVLTTFDALSAPDSNVVVDGDEGVAMVEQNQSQNGWLQGKGSSQLEIESNCRKLSVLHRLRWKRVLFIDALGRKSYMAKAGTSRNRAASALAAAARVVFFAKDSDSPSGFGELVKSDKKALTGVAEVLHTDWERVGSGDYSGKGITLDYEHAVRIRTTSKNKLHKL